MHRKKQSLGRLIQTIPSLEVGARMESYKKAIYVYQVFVCYRHLRIYGTDVRINGCKWEVCEQTAEGAK